MVLRFLLKLALFVLVVYLIIGFVPMEPNVQVQHYVVKPAPEYLGPLTRNRHLNAAERLFLNQIKGPESVAVGQDNALYTGLDDGRIIKISNGKIQTVVKVGGNDCAKDDDQKKCGRPLGLRFDSQGFLVVADSVKGIYKVNVATGEIVPIVKSSTVVNGKKILFADDVTISKSGDIYFTDVGTKFPFDHIVVHSVEHMPLGRILHYNAKTKETTELVDTLYMPNGIQLTPQEDALIFCHTFQFNLLRYNLKGSKKGQLEIFSDDLPGTPDNIRLSPRNTYWVGLPSPKIPNRMSFAENLAQYPITRKVIYTVFFYIFHTIQLLGKMTSLDIFDILEKEVESCIEATLTIKDYSLIIEVDQNGNIIRSLHSPDGSRRRYSEITEHQNVLYLGSPWNLYLGKLDLKKLSV